MTGFGLDWARAGAVMAGLVTPLLSGDRRRIAGIDRIPGNAWARSRGHGGWRLAFVAALLHVSAVSAAEPERLRAQAQDTARTLMTELGAELKAAMQDGGPGQAIDVCVERAPAMTARLSRERGWRVTRVSDRYRNPLLGMPDDWELRTLEMFRERHAEGEAYAGMSHGEVVEGPDGSRYRYMLAIPTKGLCVSCHGPEEDLAPAIRRTLSERYPHDLATGYTTGDLRGAVSITRLVD